VTRKIGIGPAIRLQKFSLAANNPCRVPHLASARFAAPEVSSPIHQLLIRQQMQWSVLEVDGLGQVTATR
jgi:hypothetical protein